MHFVVVVVDVVAVVLEGSVAFVAEPIRYTINLLSSHKP